MDPRFLPLDWTRLSRKRAGDDDDDCCVGGVCRHRRRRRARTIAEPSSSRGRRDARRRRGRVVVCLLDGDPDWFQAQLFLQDDDDTTAWGLLGVQNRDIDECLQCADGGYRVVDLTLTTTGGDVVGGTNDEVITFPDVEWTGGDMMHLKGDHITMEADKILTGAAAVPVLEGVFGGLMRRIRGDDDDDEEEQVDVLQVFPELAIVVGNMELWLPVEEEDATTTTSTPMST